jgi:hypothetical protein
MSDKAILWDFDGTLGYREGLGAGAWPRCSRRTNLRPALLETMSDRYFATDFRGTPRTLPIRSSLLPTRGGR